MTPQAKARLIAVIGFALLLLDVVPGHSAPATPPARIATAR